MSPQKTAYQAYSQASHTAPKTRQIVMLYDGMIRFIKQAKDAIEENRIEDRFNLLMKTSEVVMGLQSCLDFDNGDHIARVLYDFYSSVDARIMSIQRSNDVELCDVLIAELKEMRDVWSTIDRGEATDAPEATNSVDAEALSPDLKNTPQSTAEEAVPITTPQASAEATSFSNNITA